MEAHRTRTRWSYAEFARLPSERGNRNEVIAGDLIVTPAPGRRHQRIVTDLVTVLNAFVREYDLGQVFASPFDVLLGEDDYVEPDVLFIARDRGIKLERYRHFGVDEYWIVDPEREIVEVWSLRAGAEEALVLREDDVLHWTPVVDAETLRLPIEELF